VSKLAKKYFTVMLSGDGGDELFWGYTKRFGALISGAGDFRHGKSWRYTRRILRFFTGGQQTGSHRYASLGDWQRSKHSHLPETRLRQIFPGLSSWPVDYTVYDYHDYDQDDAAQWIRWNEFVCHLTGVLLKVDRASMFHSLEVRVPLLDREVIDVAAQIDWRDCFDLSEGIGKIPLRTILSRQVQFQSTAKKGFAPPMGKWLKTSLRPVMEEKLMVRDNLAGIAVDKKALRALYQEHLDGRRDYGWGLWPLLSLALWESRFGR
jgi:asparagine synthase (glutamine-hydrolysing)